jgi:hypothetical protein
MKCSLSNTERLSAQIENLRNLGPEQLNQAWRELFESDRPRRVCGDLLIKAPLAEFLSAGRLEPE